MKKNNIKNIVSQMTLDEKAGLCSGATDWTTKAVARLDIPQIWMTDGPHGLRKQEGLTDNLGLYESKTSVSFPAECATAASFDRSLLRKIGETLGKESQAEDVQLLLGPGVNIKRSPLCGRNFEYFSEDPLLAGELGAAYVDGVQSQGVGACVKHFLANNQETRRMISSSEVDERTLREIYMPAFETVVKKAKPWAVMCSYNKINGTFASENRDFMTDVLRKEWGFTGCVISDWGAVHNRAKAMAAGTDLTMPTATKTDGEIVVAVKDGTIPEYLLDEACINILQLVYNGADNHQDKVILNLEGDHDIACYAAEQSAVLLKNEDNILPLVSDKKIAFIGSFAKKPRYQGGGSSKVNPYRPTSAWESMKPIMDVSYSEGYTDKGTDEEMLTHAAATAKEADIAVVFVGLTSGMETEGIDRKHMQLPEAQVAVIDAVSEVQSNMVIVLHTGSPVEMPWVNKAKAILQMFLGGESVGEAALNLLIGKCNPCGRLPETYPKKLEGNPSYLSYLGTGDIVEYQEGIYVGYRYYETKKMDVLFPFGHGLSYTNFTYTNLQLDKEKFGTEDQLKVTVDVENTGYCTGKEVVQLYVAVKACEVLRPVKELKAFDKIQLAPGERKTVSFVLEKRDFSYWNTNAKCFHMPAGNYEIQIGKSAHNVVCTAAVDVKEEPLEINQDITMFSTLGEVLKHPAGQVFMEQHKDAVCQGIMKSGIVPNVVEGNLSKEEILPMLGGLQQQPLMVLKMFLTELEADIWNELLVALNNDGK